ncbi:MAG: hypothetical protein OET63_04930 [Desulfobacterales bacterium]|nr:hypothetical protein [Desulfobacterales bacterium]
MSEEKKSLGATPGLSAADDPARNPDGTLRKGYTANPAGTKPGDGVFVRSARKYHAAPATPDEIKAVADTVGVAPVQVPKNGPDGKSPITVGELLAWLQNQKALRGGIEPLRELLDRTEPKPKRIELSTDGASLRASITASDDAAEREAAEDYFDNL